MEENMQGKPKKHIGIVVSILPIILIIAGGCYLFFSAKLGMFVNQKQEIMEAAKNTLFERTKLEQVLNLDEIIQTDQYTIGFDGSMLGTDSSFVLNKSAEKLQFQQSTETGIAFLPDLELNAELTADRLQGTIPLLGDYLYTYSYTTDKTGALVAAIGQEKVTQFDHLLLGIFTASTLNLQAEDKQEMIKMAQAAYELLNSKKLDAETFTIDGSAQECQGYELSVDEKTLQTLLNIAKKFSEDPAKYDNLQTELSTWGTLKVDCFIYDKKLACVRVDMPEKYHDYEVLFHGGEIRMQNMEILQDGSEMFKRSGEESGAKETTELSFKGTPACTIIYEQETGAASLEIQSGILKGITCDATIAKTTDGVAITLKSASTSDATQELNGKIYTSHTASQKTLSGEALDVGEAAEDVYQGVQDTWNSIKSIWES